MYTQTIPFVLIFLTILAGILLNNKGLSDLKAEMKDEIGGLRAEVKSEIGGLRAEVKSEIGGLRAEFKADLRAEVSRIDARLNGIQSDLNQFYVTMGRLEGRIEALEKRAA